MRYYSFLKFHFSNFFALIGVFFIFFKYSLEFCTIWSRIGNFFRWLFACSSSVSQGHQVFIVINVLCWVIRIIRLVYFRQWVFMKDQLSVHLYIYIYIYYSHINHNIVDWNAELSVILVLKCALEFFIIIYWYRSSKTSFQL